MAPLLVPAAQRLQALKRRQRRNLVVQHRQRLQRPAHQPLLQPLLPSFASRRQNRLPKRLRARLHLKQQRPPHCRSTHLLRRLVLLPQCVSRLHQLLNPLKQRLHLVLAISRFSWERLAAMKRRGHSFHLCSGVIPRSLEASAQSSARLMLAGVKCIVCVLARCPAMMPRSCATSSKPVADSVSLPGAENGASFA